MTQPLMSVGEEARVIVPEGPPSEKLPPGEWIQKRLFPNVASGVVTVVLGAISLYLGYRLLRFVFVTGRWDPVAKNLELFMLGTFDREERWRVIGQTLGMALGIGLILGQLRSSRRDTAAETGEPFVTESWKTYAASYWSIVLFLGLILGAFARTAGPWLITAGAIALAVVGWLIAGNLPRSLRALGWTLAALSVVVSFQLMSGMSGWAWFYTTLAFLPFTRDLIGRVSADTAKNISPILVGAGFVVALLAVPNDFSGSGITDGFSDLVTGRNIIGLVVIGIAIYAAVQFSQGDRLDAARIGLLMVVGFIVVQVYGQIDFGGVDWEKWGGLHLNLVATACGILLAFPIGVLLALGRRSSLPAVRIMCVAYIEFFRGAPLITFLLAAQFFFGFFLNTDSPPSDITRATAAITLFSAAYIAENVRGGLQAVPKGQVEAGQASGLSAAKITRLIVMPQALRAVIPAMVGQFISLFKDTSLFSIISISEFLDVRALVHGQADFRGFGIAETLTFVAFGFWAFAFAMSRESQRLERKLAVGQR